MPTEDPKLYLVPVCLSIIQVPEINSRREEGEKAEKLRGDIEFRGIQFNYPARPDVEVCLSHASTHTMSMLNVRAVSLHLTAPIGSG